MIHALALRILYTVHMLVPLALVEWHLDRLHADTLRALLALHS